MLMLIFQIYAHFCQMIHYYLERRRTGSTVTHVVFGKMRVFAQSVLELAISITMSHMLITVNFYATVEVKEKSSVGHLPVGEILRMII